MAHPFANTDAVYESSTYEPWWSRALVTLHRVLVVRPHRRSMPVSRFLYERNCTEGHGALYRVTSNGLFMLTRSAYRAIADIAHGRVGVFFDDEGLPWSHIRCASYEPPLRHAHVDAIERVLALPGAFVDAPIPLSDEIGALLTREGYCAVLTIHVNTPYSFALLISQFLDGEHLSEDRVVDWCGWEGSILSGEIAVTGGWFQPGNPGYYAWRERGILIMDAGEYDAGT